MFSSVNILDIRGETAWPLSLWVGWTGCGQSEALVCFGVVSLLHAADFSTMKFLLHSSHYVVSSTKVNLNLNNMTYLVAESCWHHVMDECIVFRLNLPLNPQDCSTGFSLSHVRCPRHYPLTLWLTQMPTHAHSGCCWLASTLPWPFAHGLTMRGCG